jgi:Uri superfamily endonuclease
VSRSALNQPDKPLAPLTFIGSNSAAGTYILRIRVGAPLQISFGRFKDGRAICLEAGEYAYIGSALAGMGATCLGQRLIRHATRLGDRPPHTIRILMLEEFNRIRLCHHELRPPSAKKPRWHVDYLLNDLSVDLTGVIAVRHPTRIEPQLGKLLVADPRTVVFERGLGAMDVPGNTHLVRVMADESWWRKLGPRLKHLTRPSANG